MKCNCLNVYCGIVNTVRVTLMNTFKLFKLFTFQNCNIKGCLCFNVEFCLAGLCRLSQFSLSRNSPTNYLSNQLLSLSYGTTHSGVWSFCFVSGKSRVEIPTDACDFYSSSAVLISSCEIMK
jgi:hypothetical protein